MSKSIESTELLYQEHSSADHRKRPRSNREIASRAYELWLERGCPDGSAEEDWHQAEQEVESLETSLQP